MTSIRSVCVYCGSSLGESQVYTAQAQILGRMLAENGIRLVYGGGRIGLMGVVAEATLAAGGEVVGIIPHHLHDWEVGHTGLTELHVVDSMHTRKRMMVEMSRSEEHTSELQSLMRISYAAFTLKKKTTKRPYTIPEL